MIEEMQHRFAMNARDARRLLVTETTYVTNAAQKCMYEDEGIKEYEYQAVIDLKTSEICASLNGMVIKVKYAKAGKNFPPTHPNCRSTTIAVLSREWLDTVARKATGPITGEEMTLPPNTSYKEVVIQNPIEQRKTGEGCPNAIVHFDLPLNKGKERIHAKLTEYDSREIMRKKM